ncbi:hypothetical protein [Sporosarcina newyorkensis]|uniref:hypothetical protein n=1 Tax=Sporosarcina newyorkensis TaxID=759851 RepID=UPI003D01C18F
MKESNCHACNKEIKVVADYEPEWCCDGRECGCRGLPINPVFCDKCEKQILGESIN